jgi:hypothetical protein
MKDGRILAGTIRDDSINFLFCVWAYRPLTPHELRYALALWKETEGKRKSLKNRRIVVQSDLGKR